MTLPAVTPEQQDYTSVSELSGYRVTKDQLVRMFTRYMFASDLCTDRDVLEVACGSGQGLGLVARRAKSVRGGDFDPAIVALATQHYGDRISVQQMDAHSIPLDSGSLDAIILFEAIYYLRDPHLFVREAKRLLRKNGILLVGSVNTEWAGFNPSPFSHRYFSASELAHLLQGEGFQTELFADCFVGEGGLKSRVVEWLKEVAVRFHLIPKTMKGKEVLKRIFMGRLQHLPAELEEGLMSYLPPVPVSVEAPVKNYKVVFVLGRINQ